MFWLNVDTPHRHTCTLHRENCWTRPSSETKHKGMGTLKRDGGWLPFATEAEARAHFARKWRPRGYQWHVCSHCRE
jgi:hypothetical protein